MSRLQTDAAGRTVTGVHVTRDGQEERYTADIVVVACGALSSALLLLRSASDAHPDGLANGSGQVGRNYMRHNQSVLMALMRQPNDTVFQKTLALSDFYFGADDWEYPLGLIQMCASSRRRADQGRGAAALARLVPRHAVRRDGAALDGFLAVVGGSAAAGEPHLLRRRPGRCWT